MELLGLGSEGALFSAAAGYSRGLGVLVNAANPTFNGIRSLHRSTAFSLQLIARSLTGAFVGTWLVEASNNWAPDPGELGQPSYAGDWNDVTSLFTPAITASLTANGSQLVEPTHVPNGWRALRVTLTRVSGTSVVADPWICGKGH
jgi:hypothetical protein